MTHGPPVDTHLVNGFDLDPQGGAPTVDGDATRLDPGVGLTARADTGLAEEFVEAQASPVAWAEMTGQKAIIAAPDAEV